jgi:hypothetical protein
MLKIQPLKQIILKNTANPRFPRGFFRFGILRLAVAIIIGSCIISCTEFDQIGLDLVEQKIGLKSTDTLSLVAYTIAEERIPTNQTNRSLLGFYNDPLFGKTRASIYTETRMITTGTRIAPNTARDSVLLDSIVLIMAYNGSFGDLTTLQNLKVYELNDTIPSGAVFSNTELTTKPEVLNEQWNPSTLYRFAPTDSLYIGPDSTKVIPQLRLRLNDSFGRRFIDADPTNFASVANYLNFFKGFKITAEENPAQGAIAYFWLEHPVSTMMVYYSVLGDTVSTRSRIHEFPINEFARRYTQFENFDYQHAADIIKQQVLENDTTLGEQNLFVQSMANFKVKLRIPYLKSVFEDLNQSVIINSAQLIIPLDTLLVNDGLGYASNLLLVREDAEGNILNLRDNFVSQQYFGGVYDSKKNQYIFNITQHIQAVIREEIFNGPLYLMVSGSAENAGRAVLPGTKSETPIRIQIKYSEPL